MGRSFDEVDLLNRDYQVQVPAQVKDAGLMQMSYTLSEVEAFGLPAQLMDARYLERPDSMASFRAGNDHLTLQDLVKALHHVSENSRQSISGDVRLFDRDAIRMVFGHSIRGPISIGQFHENEILRNQFEAAEQYIEGKAQLLVAFREGVTPQDKLIEAIRIGGGYFNEQVGVNLLEQINAGANVLDLTLVRAQSEGFLSALTETDAFRAELNAGIASRRSVPTASTIANMVEGKLDKLIASDALLPQRLNITEPGVERKVAYTIDVATRMALLADLPLLPLALISSGTRNTLSIRAFRELGQRQPTSNVVDLASGELVPGFYRANPKQIRFGQHVASPNFSNGGTINDTIAELLAGKSADQVGSAIRVIYRDGVPFTLDNRRLIAFNAAGVDSIPVQVVDASDPAIATLLRNPTRMNPIAGEGQYIIVTPKVDQQSARQLLLENGLIKK